MIRDKEKNRMVKRLGELSVEERRLSMVHRKHGLGQWNVGLQKGLREYVGEYYEDERKKDIQRIALEREVQGNDLVNDMNAEIYMMERMDEHMRDAEIEREEYDMSRLGDDDETEEFIDGEVYYNHLNEME